MTERPIPFRDWEVRAILKGRKTQTRRVIKPQPAPFVQSTPDRHPTTRTDPYIDAYCGERKTPENPRGMSRDWHWWTADNRLGRLVARCPYGAPGDTLWVRETWGAVSPTDEPVPLALGQCEIEYRADLPPGCTDGPGEWPADERNSDAPKWRPSIHMPRWASRITLRITDVRVERLQDVSRQDCVAEGCAGGHGSIPGYPYSATPREHFHHIWTSIHAPGAWDANPWVWVISFERVKP
jgi:hypothetical protein